MQAGAEISGSCAQPSTGVAEEDSIGCGYQSESVEMTGPSNAGGLLEEGGQTVDEEGQSGLNGIGRTMETIAHYAKLIIAEDPVEEHRQYLASHDEEILSQSHQARQRWIGATASLISSRNLVKDARALGSRKFGGAEKVAAAVRLEMALGESPDKALLVKALQKRSSKEYRDFGDKILNELFITGERIFMWFTPAKKGHHRLLFTLSLGTCMFICFFFMCGEFDAYMIHGHPGLYDACLSQANSPYGPHHLISWISTSGTWCFHDVPDWTFPSEFLLDWGSRYAPILSEKGSWNRWFTSMLLHQSFKHLFSNSLLFLSLGCQLETKYGWWRVTFLWITAHMGGAFFSAVLEDPCTAVVGASGGVFGLMGLFTADMVLNFRTMSRPILHGLIITVFLLYFVITASMSDGSTSHLSHLGGLVCGLFPAFLFLPDLRKERVEAWFPILGGTVILLVFITLPTYFYTTVLHQLDCES